MRTRVAVIHIRQEFALSALMAILLAIAIMIAAPGHAAAAAKPENESSDPTVPQRSIEKGPQERSMKDAGKVVTLPRASEVIGKPVSTNQKQHLGEVEDLILSSDGRISYLIVTKGGLAGIGEKLCAIPWKASSPAIQEKIVLVNLSLEQFHGAPAFSDWDEFNKGGYERKVQSYYGVEAGFEDQKQTPGVEAQRGTDENPFVKPSMESLPK